MKKTLLAILAVAAILVMSPAAKADTVCAGGVCYTFSDWYQDASDPANVYDIDLTIDFSGAEASGDFYSFSLQFNSATAVAWEDMDSTGPWGTFAQGTNQSSGCNSSGGPKWCTEMTNFANALSTDGGGTYTFTFDVTFPNGTTPDSSTHIQAFQGQGALAISCDVGVGDNHVDPGESNCSNPVPEPGSLMLFGTGLLSMAGFLRRKLFS